MSALVHFEYPPPRSWEQFEELCADLFESMWSDPGLVRNGRAGQVQHGVDIVAARGGISPVGLQCKKKSRWPVKKLSISEVDHEIDEAEKFKPPLKEFYILTTAASDEKLQEHVRQLNVERQKLDKFPVEVLFWNEIVRRVARFEQVARKHFQIDSKKEFSPLLATWYATNGRIEMANEDWHLAVREVGEDFHEWPSGHVVVRQRETDALMGELKKFNEVLPARKDREKRIELRKELRYMQIKERRVQNMVRMLYSNEKLRFYMLDLDETGCDAGEILRAIIESEFGESTVGDTDVKIRLSPPAPGLLSHPRSRMSVADQDIPVYIPSSAFMEIMEAEKEFPKKFYGNPIVRVVSELPPPVRRRYAIPRIIRRIVRIMEEDRKTLEDMELAEYLDVNNWKYTC